VAGTTEEKETAELSNHIGIGTHVTYRYCLVDNEAKKARLYSKPWCCYHAMKEINQIVVLLPHNASNQPIGAVEASIMSKTTISTNQ
jgi:hypothetical protein